MHPKYKIFAKEIYNHFNEILKIILLITYTLIDLFSERMYDAYHDSCMRSIPRYIVNEQLMLVVVIVVVTYFSSAFIGNNKNQLPFSCSEITKCVFTKNAFQWKTVLCVSVQLLRVQMRFTFRLKSVYSLTSERKVLAIDKFVWSFC